MPDERATTAVAAAYRELAAGLREVAATVAAPPVPAAVAEAAVDQAAVVEALRDALRGITDVARSTVVLAIVLALAFNIWMAIDPPLRASL